MRHKIYGVTVGTPLKPSAFVAGMSNEAVNLLATILQAASYDTDQSDNIKQLIQLLESGGVQKPEVPDITDEPLKPDNGKTDNRATTAAFGVARLGLMRLGIPYHT